MRKNKKTQPVFSASRLTLYSSYRWGFTPWTKFRWRFPYHLAYELEGSTISYWCLTRGYSIGSWIRASSTVEVFVNGLPKEGSRIFSLNMFKPAIPIPEKITFLARIKHWFWHVLDRIMQTFSWTSGKK